MNEPTYEIATSQTKIPHGSRILQLSFFVALACGGVYKAATRSGGETLEHHRHCGKRADESKVLSLMEKTKVVIGD